MCFILLLFLCACVWNVVQGVALQNIFLALAVVFLSIALLAGFALAAFVSSLVLGTTLGTVGLVRMYKLNAKPVLPHGTLVYRCCAQYQSVLVMLSVAPLGCFVFVCADCSASGGGGRLGLPSGRV